MQEVRQIFGRGFPPAAPIRRGRSAVFGLLVCLPAVSVPADSAAEQGEPPREQIEFFENHVRPLLVNRCQDCHGSHEQEGGLRLDRAAAALAGGERGAAWVPHHPADSLLIQAVEYRDAALQMPPDARLKEDEIAVLVRWIEMGAPWPADGAEEQADSPAYLTIDERIAAARREHWSLLPIENPPLPEVRNSDWVRDDLDRFILAGLERQGLAPAPAADRFALVRRLYINLHGLPPTEEQARRFIEDSSPDSTARLIDELLASPRYGERWGRHWLDVARYADTAGYTFTDDRRFPFSYTYRDYVIAAFNDDKPFDRFLQEQLAADQLDLQGDNRPLAALGYLTVGRTFLNRRHDIIDDRIDVTMRGMMGLTVSCARCHDHKFDPVSIADYYALHGVFDSTHQPKELPLIGEPVDTPGYREFTAELEKRRQAVDEYLATLRGNLQHELRSRAADYLAGIAVARARGGDREVSTQAERGSLRPAAIQRWERFLNERASQDDPLFRVWHSLAGVPAEDWSERFAEQVALLEQQGQPRLAAALRESETPGDFPSFARRLGTYLERIYAAAGDEDAEAETVPDEAERAVWTWLQSDDAPSSVGENFVRRLWSQEEQNQYRRLENRIIDLTVNSPHAPPRAMVLLDNEHPANPHVFLRGDPGRRGEAVPRRFLEVLQPAVGAEPFSPQSSGRLELAQAITHPENPLTARVIVNRVWHHHFGRGIVATPSDFGYNGTPPSHPELLDHLAYWFMENGWSIKQLHRKILLSAAYLQSSQVEGDTTEAERLDPRNRLLWRQNRRRLEFEPLRDSLLLVAGNLDPTMGGKPVELGGDSGGTRRSVYGYIDREELDPMFATFDLPNPDASVGERAETTVPQQPLFLMNSPFVQRQARRVAAREEIGGAEGPEAQVAALYRAVLSRDPTPDERSAAVDYLAGEKWPAGEESSGEERENSLTPSARLAQVLLMSNEFAYTD